MLTGIKGERICERLPDYLILRNAVAAQQRDKSEAELSAHGETMMKQTLPAPREAGAVSGLEAFRRQFDRLFDDFAVPALHLGNGALMPEIDYAETDKDIVVTAELPGVDAKDVEISLTDGALTVRGEKKIERDEKKASYRLTERSYGAFERVMRLPDGIDPEKAKAEYDKGVLKITLPKNDAMRAKSRKIEIKTAAQ